MSLLSFIHITFLLITGSGFTQIQAHNLPDSIDILILQEADHLWDTYGGSIWETFDPEEIPVLIFQSPEKQWLINHPNPPLAFRSAKFLGNSISYNLSMKSPLWHYFSATIWPINQHWTTILPALSAWQSFCNQNNMPISLFPPNQLVMITLHEKFHTFQAAWLGQDFKRIMHIASFDSPPTDKQNISLDIPEDTEIAKICIREQDYLFQAYKDQNDDTAKASLFEFLSLRNQRKKLMSEEEIEVENYMELVEGTAKYIEFRLSESYENTYMASDAIIVHPQFKNYENVILNPEQSIQKAEIGETGSDRFYTTGTILCLLLDRFTEEDWKINLFKNYNESKIDLCDLLSNCL